MSSNVVFSKGCRDDVIATLTISMSISGWRALAREAIDKLGPKQGYKCGNYYAVMFEGRIREILEHAEREYLSFHKEAHEERRAFEAMLDHQGKGGD